jgi:hypothetical protein
MWDPQRLTTLWASMPCYRDSFIFYLFSNELYKCAINPVMNPKPIYSHILIHMAILYMLFFWIAITFSSVNYLWRTGTLGSIIWETTSVKRECAIERHLVGGCCIEVWCYEHLKGEWVFKLFPQSLTLWIVLKHLLNVTKLHKYLVYVSTIQANS